jgi:hypothetical protein
VVRPRRDLGSCRRTSGRAAGRRGHLARAIERYRHPHPVLAFGRGDWTVVVMRADAGAGVAATMRTGATATHVLSVAGALAILGMALLAWGARRVAQPARELEVPQSAPSTPAGQPTPSTVGSVVANVAAEPRVTHLF